LAPLGHLASRFVQTLVPVGPNPADGRWALEHLLPGERAVWARMSPADRRHAAGVARRAAAALGADATREVVAAALLHDAGKVESGLGALARAVATVAAGVAGRQKAEGWAEGSGPRRRIGRYLRHPQLGADLLVAAGSHPLTAAWAREHHLPAAQWSVPERLGRALKAADDD
jgi:hypothetical protein